MSLKKVELFLTLTTNVKAHAIALSFCLLICSINFKIPMKLFQE